MQDSLRRRISFTPHSRVPWIDLKSTDMPENIVLIRDDISPNWIADTTAKIGEWRGLIRDVYIKWAITINAMHESESSWRSKPNDKALRIDCLRASRSGKPSVETLALWPAKEAAENYGKTIPFLAAYGCSDLFGLLEEIVLEWHRIYLEDNPLDILKGKDFKDLRRHFYNRENNENSHNRWRECWETRLNQWHKKKIYDGLGNVTKSYFERTGLKRPSSYRKTDVEDWVNTINCFAEIRNLITHGVGKASSQLEEMGNKCVGDVLVFKEGESLEIELFHLQYFELFMEQLITAVNLSLLELSEEKRKEKT